ncbi:MAG: hypothetical protein ACKOAU_08030 [Pirellula sp.]
MPSTKVLRTLPLIDSWGEEAGIGASSSGKSKASVGVGSSASETSYSWVQRLLPALLLAICAGSFSTAAVLAWSRWNAPIEFGHTEEEFFASFREDAMQDPPARVLDHWRYLVDTGLPPHQPPDYFVINEFFERRKPWLIGSTVLGVMSLIVFLVMTIQQQAASKSLR